jgi:HSP20 family protein
MTIKTELQKAKPNKLSGAKRDDLFVEFMMPFDRLFDEFFNKSGIPAFQNKFGTDFFEKGSYPKVDILDAAASIVIEAAVPGMSKEDISVDVHDGVLTIAGEKRTTQDESRSYIYRELKRSSFRRSWTLADNLDSQNITAKFEDGMLYLNIPKIKPEEVAKPRQIKIQ